MPTILFLETIKFSQSLKQTQQQPTSEVRNHTDLVTTKNYIIILIRIQSVLGVQNKLDISCRRIQINFVLFIKINFKNMVDSLQNVTVELLLCTV